MISVSRCQFPRSGFQRQPNEDTSFTRFWQCWDHTRYLKKKLDQIWSNPDHSRPSKLWLQLGLFLIGLNCFKSLWNWCLYMEMRQTLPTNSDANATQHNHSSCKKSKLTTMHGRINRQMDWYRYDVIKYLCSFYTPVEGEGCMTVGRA